MGWDKILPASARQQARQLAARAQSERDAGKTVYPAQDQIFRALDMTSPEQVKVVIVGQDPYHGAGQANGLAFSVDRGMTPPPSLKNIFKELHADLGLDIPASGDLSPWAARGVLLMNTCLTVEEGNANSHKDWGWQEFTYAVFKACSELPQPIVFLLWGKQAEAFVSGLTLAGNKKAICTSHPSPFSAIRGGPHIPAFLGSRPFSQANAFLTSQGVKPVDWSL